MWYVYYGCHTLPIDNFHHWLLVTKMTKIFPLRNIHPPIQYIGICIYLPYEICTLLYSILAYVYTYLTKYTPSYTVYWHMYIPTLRNIHPPIQYIGICIYLPYEIYTLLYSILAYVYTYLTKYTPSYTVYWHMYIPTLRNIHPPIQYIGICIYLPSANNKVLLWIRLAISFSPLGP